MIALLGTAPAFDDRFEAGRLIGAELLRRRLAGDTVVIGLARGGVAVAAAVAEALAAPLDALAVRKIGHPRQPEYAIGAVTPDGGVYLRGRDGLTKAQVDEAVLEAQKKAATLDLLLHGTCPPIELCGRAAVLVDDGLATGATMLAAIGWARGCGGEPVVVAVPVGAAETVDVIRTKADAALCVCELEELGAVGFWYRDFPQVSDDEVVALLAEARRRLEPAR